MKAAALPQRIDDAAWRRGKPVREDGQAVLDALPAGAMIVEAGPAGLICRAVNEVYETWVAIARHSALGLPLSRLPIVKAPQLHAGIAAGAPHVDWHDPRGRHYVAHLARLHGHPNQTLIVLRDPARESLAAPVYDTLTGLPDRIAFGSWVDVALKTRSADGGEVALLSLDLDRLTSVNESLGYATGDMLLCAVGKRLQEAAGHGTLLARMAGDRFAMLTTGAASPEAARRPAQRVAKALMAPFTLDGVEIFVTAGVGIATTVARPDATRDELLRDAELAMNRAKRDGAGRIELYQPLSKEVARDQLLLESDLRRACERDQLFLMYQPIVSLETGKVTGFEALARWRHPQRGLVSPATFIPIAEATGVIIPIGRWALDTACRQLADWRARCPEADELMMSVNLSGIQLARDDVIGAVMAALKRHKLPPDRLKLELTESVIVENPARAVLLLERLKSLGVAIAMDDFGTGFSSMGALQKLPLDVLKVDRSFVSDMTTSRDSYKIVNAIISLARSLGLSTVAEGVETLEQAEMLSGLGCQQGQGYLYAQAMTADEAEIYLLNNG